MGTGAGAAPLLRIVRGGATDEDIAAILAVLAARSPGGRTAAIGRSAGARPTGSPRSGRADQGGSPRSTWADPASRLRHPRYPGPHAWRRSGQPG